MRKCFIHIGTHKTGTTALQQALSCNHSALQKCGYLYPHAGRLELIPGHHNIAWELVDDRRFDRRQGTIQQLIEEIRAVPRDIILSSEDFEGASGSHRFSEFVHRLQSHGFCVVLVAYLREPAEYLPSLYLELLRHGLCDTFDDFLQTALRDQAFRLNEIVFQFDYMEWIARLQQIAGVKIIVRSYENAKASTTADFLSILDLTPKALDVENDGRIHVTQPPKSYLPAFLENRLGRRPTPIELQILDALFDGFIKLDKAGISTTAKRKIVETLGGSYRSALDTYGPGFAATRDSDALADSHSSRRFGIDELFSQDLVTFVCKLTRTLEGSTPSDHAVPPPGGA